MPLALHQIALGLLLVAAVVGCGRPSSERIRQWMRDPAGADKLAAVMQDPAVSGQLRGEAAAALVEAGNGDRMEAALAGMDVDARAALVPAAVARLQPLLAAPDAERAGDAQAALYALREQAATGDARKAVDAALVPALVTDLRAGRGRAGRRAVKDMLVGVGPGVIPALMPLLPDPAVPFPTAVDVLVEVGDGDTRHQAGAALVTRARRLTALPEGLLPALARLGGKQVADFFIAEADGADAARAEKAAAAMAALRGAPEVTAFAVRKAGNVTTPAPLRERLFEVAEQDRSPAAKQALVALIAASLDAETRYRAFQALLKSAGGGAVFDGLEALPDNARYTPDEVRQRLVAPVSALPGMDTRAPLFKAFESKKPLSRLVALLAIENMGFASDAKQVAKLEKDKGTVKGLPPSDQVGRQATRIAAALRKTSS
jgi:hypothetical protein